METIAERLKYLRESLGYSKTDFAKMLEEDQPKISNYEGGKHKPSIEFLEKITLKIENLNTSWLLSGKGTMYVGGEQVAELSTKKVDKGRDDNFYDKTINFLQQQLLEKDKIIQHFLGSNQQQPTQQLTAR